MSPHSWNFRESEGKHMTELKRSARQFWNMFTSGQSSQANEPQQWLARLSTNRTLLYAISTILGLLILITITAKIIHDPDVGRYEFYHSDALFLPSLYQDIRAGTAQGWNLAPASYFFPDMALYFLIYTLVPNLDWAIIIYGFVMFSLFVAACSLVTHLLFPDRPFAIAATILISFLSTIPVFNQGYVHVILVSVSHFSVSVASVFSLACVIYLLRYSEGRKRKAAWAGLALTAFLLTFSDLHYTVQFILPLSATLLFLTFIRHIPLRKSARLVLVPLVSSGAAYGLYKLIPGLGISGDYGGSLLYPGKLKELASFLGIASGHVTLLSLVYCGFFLLLLISIVWLLIRYANRPDENIDTLLLLHGFFLTSAITATIFAYILLPLVPRYLLPLLLFPLSVNWVWLMLTLIPQGFHAQFARIVTLGLSLFSIGFVLGNVREFHGISDQLDYYPSLVACVDQAASSRNLTQGLSGYFDASYLNLLSKEALRVAPVYEDPLAGFHPYPWVTNKNTYSQPPDFLLLSRQHPFSGHVFDLDLITEIIGDPVETITCGAFEMLIYDSDENSKFAYLASLENPFTPYVEHKNGFTYPAFILESDTGRIDYMSRAATPSDPPGYLVYGPSYYTSNYGTLSFRINYHSEACDKQTAGSWEVVEKNGAEEPRVLAQGDLLSQKVSVGETLDIEPDWIIDIKVLHDGNCTLTVESFEMDVRYEPTPQQRIKLAISANKDIALTLLTAAVAAIYSLFFLHFISLIIKKLSRS